MLSGKIPLLYCRLLVVASRLWSADMEGCKNVRETTNAQLQETRNVSVEEIENVYQEEIRNVYKTVKTRADEENQNGPNNKDLMSGKKVTKSPLLIVTITSVICIAILFGAVAYLLSSTAKLQEKLISEGQKRSDVEKMIDGFNSSVKDLKTIQNVNATDFEEKYIKFSKSLNDLHRSHAEEEQKRSDVEKMLAGFNSSLKDLKTSQNESAADFEEKYIKFNKSLNYLQSKQAEDIEASMVSITRWKESAQSEIQQLKFDLQRKDDDMEASMVNITRWKESAQSEIQHLKVDLQRKDDEIRSLKKLTLVVDCGSAKRILDGDGVISLLRGGNIYEVCCDIVTDGGNWIVFQRRMDGSVDFYRTWEEYATGFGNKSGEFWLGLETVHQLTQNGNYELRVDLTDWDGSTRYAKYGKFSISGRSDGYRLTVGEYSGNAGDSLKHHNGQRFSTKDKDFDVSSNNCATRIHAAWWFWDCAHSSLNGRYNDTSDPRSGVYWHHWGYRWHYSLKAAEMKFRKK